MEHGQVKTGTGDEYIYEVKASVDDMTGEELGFAHGRLEEAGAADVYFTPVYMKKNRPGTLITCLVRGEKLEQVIDAMLRHTSTRGVRYARYSRRVMSAEMLSADTEYGPIAIKRSVYGDIVKEKPEYEDVAAAAEKHGVSIQEVRKNVINCKFK